MSSILFKDLNYCLQLKKGIQIVTIENPVYYRQLYFNFHDNIIYSENNEAVDIKKYVLEIKNVLSLDLNDRKNIALLYKKFLGYMTDSNRITIAEIEELTCKLLDELIDKTGLYVDYVPIMDIQKLFSTFGLQFKDISPDDYLSFFMNYISSLLELSRYKLVLTFNLSTILSKEEFALLNKEIEYQDIALLDIVSSKNYNNSTIVIDSDLCVF